MKSVNHNSIDLLKYHNMYEEKARRLGLESASLNITNDQSLASVKRAVELFKSLGIKAACYDLDAKRHKAVFSKRVYENTKRHQGKLQGSLEKYPQLLVRFAGYCSYFNDLSDDLKKIIINRTCYS